MKHGTRLLRCLWLLSLSVTCLQAQEKTQEKERVFLINAKSAETFERYGVSYRRVIGPARFLHNNTYILCDTAILNTETNILDAIGNVEIIQEGTRLLGDRIHYLTDMNLAEIRGRVVELIDKDENRLRTQYMDFNTKDSVGTFFNGGSMVDNEGNNMESLRGVYESKRQLFRFYDHVEMSTDTLAIKADSIYYHADVKLAELWGNIQAWHTEGFLNAQKGWYDRDREYFNFSDDVYIKTENQESWSNQAEYDRKNSVVHLYDDIQIVDTTQHLIIMGDKAHYRQHPEFAEITDHPVLATYEINRETELPDTAFVRADTLRYFVQFLGEMDSLERVRATGRLPKEEEARDSTLQQDSSALPTNKTDSLSPEKALVKPEHLGAADELQDTVKSSRSQRKAERKAKRQAEKQAFREQQAKEAAGLKQERARRDSLKAIKRARITATQALPDSTLNLPTAGLDSLQSGPAPRTDSTAAGAADSVEIHLSIEERALLTDSLFIDTEYTRLNDSLLVDIAAMGDSLALKTEISFFYAYHNVRGYRSDLQFCCDSLVFNSIDSLVRMFKAPVLWNDVNQVSSDSIWFHTKNKTLSEAEFLSNGFIISQADSVFFNQIKSKDMYAWFRDNDVYRYEARGGVMAVFYLTEDSLVANANFKECETLTAYLHQRHVERIRYDKTIKSDLHPLFVLSKEKEKLRDFNWREKERPMDRYNISKRTVRHTTPYILSKYREPVFKITKRFFPAHMSKFASARHGIKTDARTELRRADSIAKRKVWTDTLVKEKVLVDTTAQEKAPADTTAQEKAPADTTAQEKAPADTTFKEKALVDTTAQEKAWADTTAQEKAPADTTAQEKAPTDTTAQEKAPADTTAQVPGLETHRILVIDSLSKRESLVLRDTLVRAGKVHPRRDSLLTPVAPPETPAKDSIGQRDSLLTPVAPPETPAKDSIGQRDSLLTPATPPETPAKDSIGQQESAKEKAAEKLRHKEIQKEKKALRKAEREAARALRKTERENAKALRKAAKAERKAAKAARRAARRQNREKRKTARRIIHNPQPQTEI